MDLTDPTPDWLQPGGFCRIGEDTYRIECPPDEAGRAVAWNRDGHYCLIDSTVAEPTVLLSPERVLLNKSDDIRDGKFAYHALLTAYPVGTRLVRGTYGFIVEDSD